MRLSIINAVACLAYATPSAAAQLRKLLADDSKTIIAPGVYDGLTTRLALKAGFPALYMTDAGVSMSRIGVADLGLVTQTTVFETARMIANLDRSVPLIADADTCYGSLTNLGRTTALYISAEVAGFHIEDQVVNKKGAQLAGKECVSREEYVSRIRAAVLKREELASDIVIIARTDALQQLGLEEALVRLKEAVAAGADVAMLEAFLHEDECKPFAEAFKGTGVPLIYGMVQGSKAFKVSPANAKGLGLKIVVYAAACLLPMYAAIERDLKELKERDCVTYEQVGDHIQLFETCGRKELMAFDKKCTMPTSCW